MSAEQKSLVFGWNYSSWGGAQIYTLAIVKLAVEQGWNVRIVMPEASSSEITKQFEAAGAQLEYIRASQIEADAGGIGLKVKRQLARIRSEIELLRKILKHPSSTTIVHLDIGPWQSWQLYTLLALKGYNVFATIHNYMPKVSPIRTAVWKLRMLFVSSLSGVNFFTANDHTRTMLESWLTKGTWQTTKVTRASIDKALIDAAKEKSLSMPARRTSYGISEDSFVVLCVGQFIDRKGRWTFLDAAQELLSIDRTYEFVWVMPSAPSPADQIRIDSYELGDRFHAIESANLGSERTDVLSFFTIANVFALPSYREGLPIAILEAMTLKIPTISTNIFAIPEAVIDGVTGVLIEPNNKRELVNAIQKIRGDRNFATHIADVGRQYVLEKFDERASAKVALQTYEAALEG